jgi:hypothetical protein
VEHGHAFTSICGASRPASGKIRYSVIPVVTSTPASVSATNSRTLCVLNGSVCTDQRSAADAGGAWWRRNTRQL